MPLPYMIRREIKISDNHTRIIYGEEEPETRGISGVSVMETRGSDGSLLEKPMSRAYMNHIKARTFSSEKWTKKVYPGDYGSGKKVPRDR